VQNALRDSGPLVSALHHACSTLDSFLTHCPEGWSNKILKVSDFLIASPIHIGRWGNCIKGMGMSMAACWPRGLELSSAVCSAFGADTLVTSYSVKLASGQKY